MFANKKNKMRRQIKKKVVHSTETLDEEELIKQISMRPVIYDRSLKAYRKIALRKQCWAEISEKMNVPVEVCRRRWRSLRDSFGKHYKLAQRSKDEQEANRHRKWLFYDKMKFLIPHIDGVSYDLDKILDELGDISEDGQSINCEPIDVDAANASLDQMETTANTREGVEEELAEDQHNNTNNIQHSSVSVQATDLMSFSMETSEQQGQYNQRNIENNASDQHYPRPQHHCNNHNNSTLNMQCSGDANTTDTCGLILDSDEKFLLSCAPTMRRLTNRKNALARLKIQQILFDIEFQQENN